MGLIGGFLGGDEQGDWRHGIGKGRKGRVAGGFHSGVEWGEEEMGFSGWICAGRMKLLRLISIRETVQNIFHHQDLFGISTVNE